MKGFNRLLLVVIMSIALIFFGSNIYLANKANSESNRLYKVEINRLEQEIKEKGLPAIHLDEFTSVKNVSVLENQNYISEFIEETNSDYVIRYIDGVYYRFDYEIEIKDEFKKIILAVNIVMGIISLCVIAMLLYIRIKLLKPFNKLKEVPYELSKGNLTVGLKENKNRYFGRFVWGLDLLRENIEEQRIKELALQKEKKTLVLSISHDIKTPLSAIKLYSKALSRNLYDSDEKRKEIAESISAKADEIENFVGQIIKASSEDFLNLEVKNSEYYLSDLINKISEYYTEKLSLLKIEFKIGEYNNCLLKGDIDRAVEVLQNVIENAIKYGDGGFINIVISEEEDCRIITVENSGCTLSENELPHIFDSFWRGSNAEKNSGSGLGLYICRQLMTKMDGDIFAECEYGKMKISSVFRMI